MKINARLSIGVPAYNQGVYLESTLQSLLAQTEQPLEIVVSNNFSTDTTAEVLKQFEGQVKIISPPSHLGMMEHWNFLVTQMSGEWFSILSSDDIAKPNFVSTLLRGIRRDRDAVLVRGGWETIDAVGSIRDKRYLLSVRNVTTPPQTLYEQLLGPKMNFAAFAAKKSMWEKVGGFPEECALNGDWGFWVKLSPYGVFVYEHEIVSQYRSAYRSDLEKKRLLRELRDELAIYTKLIPEAVRNIPNIDEAKIIKATRQRLKKRLSLASQWLDDQERAQAFDILEAWNKVGACACDEELNQFRTGMRLDFIERFSRVRKITRYIYSWLR